MTEAVSTQPLTNQRTERRAEWRWLAWFAGIVLLASCLPYLLGYQQQNQQWAYSGFLFAIEDCNSYAAKMLEGAAGNWLFRTPYTAYPQGGMLAFVPYLLLGKLTAPPGQHDQLIVLYHAFRLLAGALLIFATYDFISLFVKQIRWRRWATALIVLGGGLGWLAFFGVPAWGGGQPGLDVPLEFYSPETFGFLMILGLPHLAFARALLLWGLVRYLRPVIISESWRSNIPGGLLWLALGFMQPLTVVIGWAVIGLHLLATGVWQAFGARDWQIWRVYLHRAVIMGILSSPLVVYTLAAFQFDPFLQKWQQQNLVLSPPIGHYLLAYGLLLPLAIMGAWRVWQSARWSGILLIAWVVALPALIYAPYGLQRRLAEGGWVAISVLAILWLEGLSPRLQGWGRAWLSLSFLTTLGFFVGGLFTVNHPAQPVYLPAAEVKLFNNLAARASKDAVVLAEYATSNALPAYAPVRTLVGLEPESMNLTQIQPRVDCFYHADCPDSARAALLREFHVRYVLWGPAERAAGSWDVRSAPYLRLVQSADEYALFEVIPDALRSLP